MLPAPLLAFDLDGTLVDSAGDLAASLNAILRADGLAAHAEALARSFIGHGTRRLVEQGYAAAGRPLEGAALDAAHGHFLAHYDAHLADSTVAYPDAARILALLQDEGWRLAVCTNKGTRYARKLLALLGLEDRFAAVCGPDHSGVRKPDPRHLLSTIAAAGGDPARSLLVGDTDADVLAARGAGVPVIVVAFGYSKVPVASLGADAVVESFAALPAAIARLRGGA